MGGVEAPLIQIPSGREIYAWQLPLWLLRGLSSPVQALSILSFYYQGSSLLLLLLLQALERITGQREPRIGLREGVPL